LGQTEKNAKPGQKYLNAKPGYGVIDFVMAINLTPDQEQVLLSIAQKVRGSRGGKAKSLKKQRASARNGRHHRAEKLTARAA
jgi:hypothetical protein